MIALVAAFVHLAIALELAAFVRVAAISLSMPDHVTRADAGVMGILLIAITSIVLDT